MLVLVNYYYFESNLENLYRCIDSILNQNIKVNIKIIITQWKPTLVKIKKKLMALFNSNIISFLKILDKKNLGKKLYYEVINNQIKLSNYKYINILSSNFILNNNQYHNDIKNLENSMISLGEDNLNSEYLFIDKSKFNDNIFFNYEKFNEYCIQDLLLTFKKIYGDYCISYNIVKNNLTSKKDNMDLLDNYKDFMLSYHKKIQSKNHRKIWFWNDLNNTKPVTMTVALPALNAEKIIWLALESLKNQINIDFSWELICFEEEGKSREIIKEYIGKLPGCVRIIHKILDESDMYYNLQEIKRQKCASYYTLMEKWINISYFSDNNSKIFVKHACDCYSPPKRLYIHNEHFKNEMCYYSTQPKGYFYNILNDKYFLYNGFLNEPVYWDKYGINKSEVLDSNYKDNKNSKIRCCHLNMSLRTNIMKKISLPLKPKRCAIDTYIILQTFKLTSLRPEEHKIIFSDDEIDKDNWKYSLDTDGYNNISLKRKEYYLKYDKKIPFIIPKNNNEVLNKIPEYIMNKLKKMVNIDCYVTKTSNMDKFTNKFMNNIINDLKLNNIENNKTLLDVGCGIGSFAKKLSKYYNTTGEDINENAINRAKIENNEKNINYENISSLKKLTKFDIVFVRGVSFFINCHILSNQWKFCLEHLLRRTNNKFIYSQWQPISHKGKIGYTYYHFKDDIYNLFSKYGNVNIKFNNNNLYIILTDINKNLIKENENIFYKSNSIKYSDIIDNLSGTDNVYLFNNGLKYNSNSKYVLKTIDQIKIKKYKNNSFLDAGCGDGFWCNLLNKYYNITGEDLSKGGLYVAITNNIVNKTNINYKLCSSLDEKTKYDLIFSRHPSFLANIKCDNPKFISNINKLYKRTNKLLILVLLDSFVTLEGNRNLKKIKKILNNNFNKIEIKYLLNNYFIFIYNE